MHGVSRMKALDVRLYARAARPTTGEARAAETLRDRLAPYGPHLRRVSVRIEQRISGPGKVDQTCRVEVTMMKVTGAPQFVVEGRAATEHEAITLAADAAAFAVRREVEAAVEKQSRRKPHAAARSSSVAVERTETEGAELTQADEVERAREAEQVAHHFTPRELKTARPARGRHIHKTLRQSRATSARETTAARRPSRKSTRRSANRSKRDSNQARRTKRSVRSPEETARRATLAP